MSALGWALILTLFSGFEPASVAQAEPECVGWVACGDLEPVCVSWDDGTLSNRVIDCTEERGEVGL